MASAHHILGIPHYKYGEDYPQIPFVEVMAVVGAKNLHFTYFPGTPKPGERIRFKLYAYDQDTNEPFTEPLKVEFFKHRTVGSDERLAGPTPITRGVGPEANDYKFFFTFDTADSYRVVVYFPNGEQVERIEFPVEIGETDPRPLFAGAVGVLGLSIFSVAMVKRRRQRKDGVGKRRTARKKGAR